MSVVTGYTLVTASNLRDAAKNPLSNATITFQPVTQTGAKVSVRDGSASPGPSSDECVQASVINGQICTPQPVVGSLNTTGALTLTTAAALVIGSPFGGPGVPAGATIASGSGTNYQLSPTTTTAESGATYTGMVAGIQLMDPNLTDPGPIGYKVICKDALTNHTHYENGYNFVTWPTGTAFDFDTYVPVYSAPFVTIQSGPPGAPGTNGTNGINGEVTNTLLTGALDGVLPTDRQLFDPATMIAGYTTQTPYLSTAVSGFYMTPIFRVLPGGAFFTNLQPYAAGAYQGLFLDKTGAIVSDFSTTTVTAVTGGWTVAVPSASTIVACQFGLNINAGQAANIAVYNGTSQPASYREFAPPTGSQVSKNARRFLPVITDFYDPLNITQDYLLAVNGSLASTPTSYAVSNYVPCTPGVSLYSNTSFSSGSSGYGPVWYDQNKVFVTGTPGGVTANTAMVPPPGCYFMRIPMTEPVDNALLRITDAPVTANSIVTGVADFYNQLPFIGKNLATSGDSIMQSVGAGATGFTSANGAMQDLLAKALRCNLAIPGGISGRRTREVLQGIPSIHGGTPYVAADFANISLVLNNSGTNDWGVMDTSSGTATVGTYPAGNTRPLGTPGDLPSASTFCGDLYNLYSTLRGWNPTMVIADMTLLPRFDYEIAGTGTIGTGANANKITVSSSNVVGMYASQIITSANYPAGTTVVGVSGSVITLSNVATSGAGTSVSFTAGFPNGNPINALGHSITDYNAAKIAVAALFGVQILDLYKLCQICPSNQTSWLLQASGANIGLHPVASWYLTIGVPMIASWLNSLTSVTYQLGTMASQNVPAPSTALLGVDANGNVIPSTVLGAWTHTAETPTASSGSFTSASADVAVSQIGKTVSFLVTVTITTNGSASGSLSVPLPFTSKSTLALQSYDGTAGSVSYLYANSASLVMYAPGGFFANGQTITCSETIEIV